MPTWRSERKTEMDFVLHSGSLQTCLAPVEGWPRCALQYLPEKMTNTDANACITRY